MFHLILMWSLLYSYILLLQQENRCCFLQHFYGKSYLNLQLYSFLKGLWLGKVSLSLVVQHHFINSNPKYLRTTKSCSHSFKTWSSSSHVPVICQGEEYAVSQEPVHFCSIFKTISAQMEYMLSFYSWPVFPRQTDLLVYSIKEETHVYKALKKILKEKVYLLVGMWIHHPKSEMSH